MDVILMESVVSRFYFFEHRKYMIVNLVRLVDLRNDLGVIVMVVVVGQLAGVEDWYRGSTISRII
jgi:hypothetical protein